ncbi:MAG: Flp pilus assembly complex ATPase component TadA [Opitutales bacterium]|nr:Flp pilus assembly complex ATPase component TadA [Opitutales bacterium]
MALARIQVNILSKLSEFGNLDEEAIKEILSIEEELSGEAVDNMLLEKYGVSEFQLLVAKAKAFDLTPFNASLFQVSEHTFEYLERDFCLENKVLPIGTVGEFLVVAVSNPFDVQLNQKIQDITRLRVSTLLALERDINAKLETKDEEKAQVSDYSDVVDALGNEFEEGEELEDAITDEESAPIIKLANRIIEDAYFSGGSDIHIDPFEKETRIRVRIDGVLQEKLSIPAKVSGALMARLKVMSDLDIAEKRLPQDGRIVFKHYTRRGIDVDLRVSTAPLNHGEGAVMRILDKQKSTLPLPALGFSEQNLSMYRELITRPYGMILHCGPTGSGKSMTLYSALNEINTPDLCIRTAEDPIEYTLPGLAQMQMNRKIGLTFATALRAFLRQDPDIILVGEIRDTETAGIAVEAALTGHMLFSTLHTNDAPSTVARLTEMGVEPFMISASIVCVCAQRLMRRLNKNTKGEYQPEGNELEIIQKAIGYTGPVMGAGPADSPLGPPYKGRVGIHELMPTSEELVKGINDGLEAARLKMIAMRNGMRTLHQDSMLKVMDGLTSMEESLSTVPPDMEDLSEFADAV